MPMVGQIDLPLGKGVACVEGSVIRVSANLGGNAWDSLRLPDLVTEALHQLRQAEYDLGGTIDVATGNLELAIAGSYPFGPWDLDGRLIVSNKQIRVEGETDFDLGPLNFGGMDASVQIMGNSFMATASSEADLGVAGAKLKADFFMTPAALAGSAKAKLWGWNVKGDLKFNRYRFTGANLTTGFDIGPVGGKLKLKIEPNKVSVKVKGSFVGKKFDVNVNSNGRFKVAGRSFKL